MRVKKKKKKWFRRERGNHADSFVFRLFHAYPPCCAVGPRDDTETRRDDSAFFFPLEREPLKTPKRLPRERERERDREDNDKRKRKSECPQFVVRGKFFSFTVVVQPASRAPPPLPLPFRAEVNTHHGGDGQSDCEERPLLFLASIQQALMGGTRTSIRLIIKRVGCRFLLWQSVQFLFFCSHATHA